MCKGHDHLPVCKGSEAFVYPITGNHHPLFPGNYIYLASHFLQQWMMVRLQADISKLVMIRDNCLPTVAGLDTPNIPNLNCHMPNCFCSGFQGGTVTSCIQLGVLVVSNSMLVRWKPNAIASHHSLDSIPSYGPCVGMHGKFYVFFSGSLPYRC